MSNPGCGRRGGGGCSGRPSQRADTTLNHLLKNLMADATAKGTAVRHTHTLSPPVMIPPWFRTNSLPMWGPFAFFF